jgi:transposase
MMGRQTSDQSQLFYLFNLEARIPERHLLRRINPIVTRVLTDLRTKFEPFYSDIGRPSIDPELMIRMLIVGYCYGVRFERKLCEEVDWSQAKDWHAAEPVRGDSTSAPFDRHREVIRLILGTSSHHLSDKEASFRVASHPRIF